MKRMAPLVALMLLLISFSSCRRNYTCTCTIVTGKTKNPVVVYELDKMSPRTAKRECDGRRGAVYGLLYDCSLEK